MSRISFAPALRCSALALASALLGSGCNLNKLTANATSGMLEFGAIALDRESDLEFARGAFPASLKTLETFLVSSPKNESLLLLLARGYNSYAFAMIESELERADLDGTDAEVDELTRRAKIHYLRGRAYGFRLLDEPALERAAFAGDYAKLESELAKLDRKQAPGLFWATYGWLSEINLAKDDPEALTGLGSVERMLARMLELDPDYNAGTPLVLQAVYHASRPKIFGGKPEIAKQFFDRAMAKWGRKNLLVPYLYARFYCPQVQDQALFDRLIAQVLEADVDAEPDLRLNTEVARARARFWRAHADDLIVPQ
ncbi:MAG: TRAP transporter TatT component family protein [Nannocystaceae bacterium]